MRSTLFLNASFQLAVAVLLATAPFISAIPNPSQPDLRGLESRSTIVPSVGKSIFIGCFSDNNDARTLPVQTFDSQNPFGFTPQLCVNACDRLNHPIAGLEFGVECRCGDKIENNAQKIDESKCNVMPCGDENLSKSQSCGGPNAMVVYQRPQ